MCHGKGFETHFGFGCFPFLGRDFSQIIHKIRHHWKECTGQFGSWVPYNMKETRDGYLISVPLPGHTKEDVNVSLIGNSLNIKSSRPKGVNVENKGEEIKDESKRRIKPFLRHFFTFIDVDMDIPLPADADLDSIKSMMSNGLLKIKVGKKPAKIININVEGNN